MAEGAEATAAWAILPLSRNAGGPGAFATDAVVLVDQGRASATTLGLSMISRRLSHQTLSMCSAMPMRRYAKALQIVAADDAWMACSPCSRCRRDASGGHRSRVATLSKPRQSRCSPVGWALKVQEGRAILNAARVPHLRLPGRGPRRPFVHARSTVNDSIGSVIPRLP